MTDTLLEVENLSRRFSGLLAVNDVSFNIKARSITGLIGPNGAGKTTCFNMITGLITPTSGRVRFNGTDITGLSPEKICKSGLVRTFQIVRPLPDMTALENVVVGALVWARGMTTARDFAYDTLEIVGLQGKADRMAKQLTLPDLKMLELARALATKPKLLLLDEVMAGLRPNESDRIVDVLRNLNRHGLTLVLVEHVMRIVMSITERVVVLHHGQAIYEGTPEEVTKNPLVIESYLGQKASV